MTCTCLTGTRMLQEIEGTLHGRSANSGKRMKKGSGWYVSRASGTETRHAWRQRNDDATVSKWVVPWVRGSRTKCLYTIYVLHIVAHPSWHEGLLSTHSASTRANGCCPHISRNCASFDPWKTWICNILLHRSVSSQFWSAASERMGLRSMANDMDKPPSPRRCLKCCFKASFR